MAGKLKALTSASSRLWIEKMEESLIDQSTPTQRIEGALISLIYFKFGE
jgi:hypothetical protein